MLRITFLVSVFSFSPSLWAICEVNSQQPSVHCQQTEVLPTSEFTQDLVVREPTEGYGWFDHIRIESGGVLTLRGTARWTVEVLEGGQLIVRGMAKEIRVLGGKAEVRGMADEVVSEGGEVLISGAVGRISGGSEIQVVHGAVIAGRPETRGQPGDRFAFEGTR